MRGKRSCNIRGNRRNRITPADAGKTCCCSCLYLLWLDHPRGCGENSPFAVATRFLIGSPPRMRGKQCGQSLLRCSPGITPADAGKTKTAEIRHRRHWDHPRGCGENAFCPRWAGNCRGSPPRMRGKHPVRLAWSLTIRITPADAGKTLRRGASSACA